MFCVRDQAKRSVRGLDDVIETKGTFASTCVPRSKRLVVGPWLQKKKRKKRKENKKKRRHHNLFPSSFHFPLSLISLSLSLTHTQSLVLSLLRPRIPTRQMLSMPFSFYLLFLPTTLDAKTGGKGRKKKKAETRKNKLGCPKRQVSGSGGRGKRRIKKEIPLCLLEYTKRGRESNGRLAVCYVDGGEGRLGGASWRDTFWHLR